MITSANLTLSELKLLHEELLLNKTDKVSDISDDSVLNGVAFGNAKVAQKAIKDISIVEAQLFPEYAVGEYLDKAAVNFGVSERKGALGSSTYIKVVGDEGTEYLAGINTFISQNGIVFEIESGLTIDSSGFGYVKVRSIDTGVKTNVSAASIITVTPQPTGHVDCINEYMAVGGRDEEDDETFRIRIKNNSNILSKGTLENLTQIFQQLDDRVLRIEYLGISQLGKRTLSVVTQNGVNLTEPERTNLLNEAIEYMPISDVSKFGDVLGIQLVNVEWYFVGGDVGVDFRVDIVGDSDTVRQNIQISLSKYLDFRYWENGKKIEWDDMLRKVKNTEGVRYVPDQFFLPKNDEVAPIGKLPRIKNFIMRDLDGNIIFDSNGNLTPVFYPAQ